jgi:hypothetical protein
MHRPNSVRATSREAYADNGENFKTIAERIMDRMYDCLPRTRAELAQELGVATATMSGRVRELVLGKKLVESGTRACSVTGRNVRALRRG